MSKSYWAERTAKAQEAITNKHIEDIEKQLTKYYSKAMKRTIADFEATYDKLLATVADGVEPTPADLYKLDRYWELQAQLKTELEKLGDRQEKLFSDAFEEQFFDIYNSISIPSATAYSTIDSQIAQQLINEIWVADGKSFSQRIWGNTEKLIETLNDELINCVATGRSTEDLKQLLQKRFKVSYSNADSIVKTETAHIQTQAARKRYEDYGIQEVEVWADEDERRCEVCGKLHQKRYPVGAQMPIPAHPRCRCAIIPVVEDEKPKAEELEYITPTNKFGQKISFDEKMDREYWKEPIDIISNLANEYETRIVKVKTGGNAFGGGVFNSGTGVLQLGTRKKSVAYHEFGHSIADSQLMKLGVEDTKDFWKEIKAIERKYKKAHKEGKTEAISFYMVGSNTDEFLAEAFTQAKMVEKGLELPKGYGKDTTYSKEVLEVIDKYFKKKKKKK